MTSQLIRPHGGKLINRMLEGNDRERWIERGSR